MESSQIDIISKTADVGRFVGAPCIFYFHVGLATGYLLSGWGEYAVAFFIILSGLSFICFSSDRPSDLPSYLRYIAGRIASIFPTFVVINAAIFAASYLYPSALGRPFAFLEFLFSSTGVSQYLGYRYLSTVMWFVPFIMQAYLLFPVIDKCLNRVPDVFVVMISFIISLSFVGMAFFYWPSHATEMCRNWSAIFGCRRSVSV